MYNKVYNKTTIEVSDLLEITTSPSKSTNKCKVRVRQSQYLEADVMSLNVGYKNKFIGWTLLSIMFFWVLIFPIFLVVKYYKKYKEYKAYRNELS